ncbi:MAG: hypothetical protein CMM25_02445 [Rhodospirillaceae bacterium]|nr:hypothetical protein [Rhodospirillaceae bacterium]
MKIALCLSGYFENAGGLASSLRGNEYINKKIISNHDVDVFVHSWDLKNEDLVKKVYNITDCVFEKQKDFSEKLKMCNKDWLLDGEDAPPGMYATNSIFKTLSVSYSRMMANQIKCDYEEANSFKYDCVVMARFDLGQRGKQHRQRYYATNINFDASLDMNYVYSAFWDQLNHGFADHWFYSNSENINVVSSLHHNLVEYYQKNGDYVKSVLNCWPDSNEDDEFSNEMLQPKKSIKLKRWDKWGCIDNHKLYKWHFINQKIYDKCRFLDITE